MRAQPPSLVSGWPICGCPLPAARARGLHRTAGVVLGLDFGKRHLRVALADLAHEVVAERRQALLKLRRRGLLRSYGQTGLQPAKADFFAVAQGPIDVTVRNLTYWTEADRDGDDLATLVELVATGRLHPEIGVTGDWTDTRRVLAAMRDRRSGQRRAHPAPGHLTPPSASPDCRLVALPRFASRLVVVRQCVTLTSLNSS